MCFCSALLAESRTRIDPCNQALRRFFSGLFVWKISHSKLENFLKFNILKEDLT